MPPASVTDFSTAATVLTVHGLGPETADAILLYAAGRPVFVADAYTRRVLARRARESCVLVAIRHRWPRVRSARPG